MKFRLGLSLMTALVLAACSDGGGEGDATASESGSGSDTDTDTGGEPATEVSLADFFALAEVAFCEWQVECRGYGTMGRCGAVNHFEDRLNMRRLSGVGPDESIPVAYYKEAVEVGRMEYDESLAAICLAYVRAQTCDIWQVQELGEDEVAGRAACEGLFAGRMGKNGPCLSALECAETAICGFDPACSDMCCVGACRVFADLQLGEPCTGNRPCEPDTYCAFDPNTAMSTVCTAAPKVGQPCPDYVCVGDAICEFTGGDTPVCLAPKPAGKACDYDAQCSSGLICTHDENYQNGKCLRPADEGEPCDPTSPDAVCRRFDNDCDAAKDVCVPLPANGEACPKYRCQGDLFCVDDMSPHCSPVADAGEPCAYLGGSYVPCSGDNVCDPNDDFSVYKCLTPSPDSPCPVPEDPLGG